MRPGVGWILAGVALLGLGIVTTALRQQGVWYGAIVVGLLWIVRGIWRLSRSAPQPPPPMR